MAEVKAQVLHDQPFPRAPQHRAGQAPDTAGLLHDLLADLPCAWKQTIERQYLIDESNFFGRLGVNFVAGVKIVSGAFESHQLLKRKPLSIAGYRAQIAEMRVEEHCVIRAESDVA